MNYRIVCIVVLLLSASICHGQKRYLFHIYNTKNGLANNTIFSINQDKNGYVYFGTEAGLTRFDGYKMNNDVIPELTRNLSCVDKIERDKDGFIITTSQMQGIFLQQYDFTFKQYLQEKYAIGRNIFTVLKVIPENRILLSGGSELSVFENGVFTKFYDNKKDRISILALEYDKSGNIWLGGVSNLGGVAVFSAGDTTYTPYFIPEMKDVSVVHMLFDKQGDLLIGSRKGLYKITFHTQGNFKKGYRVTQPFPQIESVINHLYIDSENNLWIATSSSGVYKAENGIITENITQESGLPAAGVMTTFQDSEKNYWFGTVSGVARLSDFNRYTYSHNSDLSGSIANDEFGRIYHFTQSGIFIIHNNIEKMHELKRSVVDPKESKFYWIGNNQLWILNNKGLYSVLLDSNDLDLSKLKLRADLRNLTLGYIRFMTMHDDGNVWIGAEKGLFVFRDNKIRVCRINHNNASKIRPVDLVKDKYGYYWVGDFNYGLYRMRLSRASKEEILFDSVKVYKCLKADSSFVTAWVQDLMMDAEGNVWYSSLFTGCYKLSIDNQGVNSWELFSNANGLSSNKVDQIIQDELHNIWFCSVKGADCYLIKTGEFICFNKKDGLGDQVYDVLSINNHLYLEYDEGIMVINDFAKENKQKESPKVFITGIMVNGNPDSLAFYPAGHRKYKYNQNYISFDFTTISFKYEDVMQFQFLLEGLNKEWSELTQNRNISFSNLAPGKYCFLVRAKSPDGVMSQQNAMYSFIIAPPLYRTWWFILLAAIAFASLVYLAYQYRIQQLLKVERLRTRIASDLHDDIGSTLSSISILSEILSVQLDNTPKSAEMIGKIGINARTMLESMDDIIWSVNPSNDKFRNLILRIREYAIPLFESKQIKFHIQSDEAMDLIRLPMDFRRNMYLIAKEAVNNLIKYSCCKEARIEFYENSPYFFMIISDNGIGFNQESPSSRNGLKNMKRRAEQIKAHLEILSEMNSGSTVKLKIKII